MNKMSVYVGTKEPRSFEIDLDDYGVAVQSEGENVEEAYRLLHNVLTQGHRFAGTGNRNHDAVNGCIALYVLGYDPEKWFETFFDVNGYMFHERDIQYFMEHVERVVPYLESWGKPINRSDALDFAI